MLFVGILSISLKANPVVAITSSRTLTGPHLQNSSASLSKSPQLNGLIIKIVSPPRGQQVPTGGNLTVSGVSSDNPSTDCQVSLLLNDMKPYQKTIPTGKSNSGGENFSSWKYNINDKNGSIKAGLNKITSKLTCNNPNQPNGISKWYSINITGTSDKLAEPSHSTAKIPVLNVQNQSMTSLLQANSSKTSPIQFTASTYKPIQPTNIVSKTNASVNIPRTLVAFLDVGKDPITPGQKQTIKVIVSDGTTNAKIAGAKVTTDVQPTSSSILERQFVGFTGPDGKISKSWKMTDEGNSESTYNIYSKISAVGYKDKTISATFKASSPQNTVNNIGNRVDDLSNKIIDEVKKGFDQNALMPKLPIPFD